jgi:hypothetical protein
MRLGGICALRASALCASATWQAETRHARQRAKLARWRPRVRRRVFRIRVAALEWLQRVSQPNALVCSVPGWQLRNLASMKTATLICMLALPLISATARAHRGPAVVLSLLAWEQDAPSVFRLNEGLAQRRDTGWQYVCPALWGDDNITPAAVIEGGPVVIGGSTGLFLLDEQGAVTEHPDVASRGFVIGFARGGGQLFALRMGENAPEVVRVTAVAVERVWSGPGAFSALAAEDSALHVLGIDGDQLLHVQLSLDGGELASERIATPEPFVGLSARVIASDLYITAVTFMGLQLGQIEQGAWALRCTGGDNLSGPVEVDGQRLVTINGKLTKLAGGCSEVVATPEYVSCVGQEAGHSYACTKSGANTLAAEGVGVALFGLGDLQPPDLGSASPEQASICTAQWNRYQEDLLAIGVIDSTTRAGSGGAELAGQSAAGVGANGGTGAAGASSSLPQAGRSESSGCQLGRGTPGEGSLGAGLALLGIVLGGYRARRRTSRRAP